MSTRRRSSRLASRSISPSGSPTSIPSDLGPTPRRVGRKTHSVTPSRTPARTPKRGAKRGPAAGVGPVQTDLPELEQKQSFAYGSKGVPLFPADSLIDPTKSAAEQLQAAQEEAAERVERLASEETKQVEKRRLKDQQSRKDEQRNALPSITENEAENTVMEPRSSEQSRSKSDSIVPTHDEDNNEEESSQLQFELDELARDNTMVTKNISQRASHSRRSHLGQLKRKIPSQTVDALSTQNISDDELANETANIIQLDPSKSYLTESGLNHDAGFVEPQGWFSVLGTLAVNLTKRIILCLRNLLRFIRNCFVNPKFLLTILLIVSSFSIYYLSPDITVTTTSIISSITTPLNRLASMFPFYNAHNLSAEDSAELSRLSRLTNNLVHRLDTLETHQKSESLSIRSELSSLRQKASKPATKQQLFNFFAPGFGAVVDPHLSSPTAPRVSHKSEFPYLKRLQSRLSRTPAPLPQSAALGPWDDVGDCWCVAAKDHKAQLAVLVPIPFYPTNLVVEHIPRSQTLTLTNAPQNISIWAEITSDQARELIGEPYDPLLSSSYALIGTAKYEIDKNGEGVNVQMFKINKDLENWQSPTRKIVVRAESNWGGEHTCFYRVKMFGKPVTGRVGVGVGVEEIDNEDDHYHDIYGAI